MSFADERWLLFIDFAATFHETLVDTKWEVERMVKPADLTSEELEATLDRLAKHWNRLIAGLDTFTRVSEAMLSDSTLTQNQKDLMTKIILKIRESAVLTDSSLRVFFEDPRLIHHVSNLGQNRDLKKVQ